MYVLTKSELFDAINAMIVADNLELFDLELPTGSKGVMRVFLCHKGGNCEGITHEACASVSRKINYDPRFEWLRERYSMEVSSPGINRKLRSPVHFQNAIGERIKFTADTDDMVDAGTGSAVEENGRVTMIALLKSADESHIEVAVEGEEDRVLRVPIRDITKARVDFLF